MRETRRNHLLRADDRQGRSYPPTTAGVSSMPVGNLDLIACTHLRATRRSPDAGGRYLNGGTMTMTDSTVLGNTSADPRWRHLRNSVPAR